MKSDHFTHSSTETLSKYFQSAEGQQEGSHITLQLHLKASCYRLKRLSQAVGGWGDFLKGKIWYYKIGKNPTRKETNWYLAFAYLKCHFPRFSTKLKFTGERNERCLDLIRKVFQDRQLLFFNNTESII